MHLKYKAKTWDDIIGNKEVKDSLKKTNLSGRAVLLEGVKGCGKSVIADIIAREFGVNKENIRVLNSVQTSSVAEMRELIDNLSRVSLFGNKKALIIDEPQELSHKAQEALLLPLENLSDNILVIMCTATPERVESMLLERFIRFKVRQLNKKESLTLIDSVCKKEGVILSKPVKAVLIEKSEGIPRRILIGITKLIEVSDIEEAKYLLDLATLCEENLNILELFKVMLLGSSWAVVSLKLRAALIEESPDNIRVGLINLIGSKLMSSYLSGAGEGERLTRAWAILKSAEGYPEKANLMVAIYKWCQL